MIKQFISNNTFVGFGLTLGFELASKDGSWKLFILYVPIGFCQLENLSGWKFILIHVTAHSAANAMDFARSGRSSYDVLGYFEYGQWQNVTLPRIAV